MQKTLLAQHHEVFRTATMYLELLEIEGMAEYLKHLVFLVTRCCLVLTNTNMFFHTYNTNIEFFIFNYTDWN